MKQTCSYREKYLEKTPSQLEETSLHPRVSQILVAIKDLLFNFAFLPLQIQVHVHKDFHSQDH